jgi:hypothetical protein
MTVAFESLPGNSQHLLDGPQFGLTRSPEVNRLNRHGLIMHKPHRGEPRSTASLTGHSGTLAHATALTCCTDDPVGAADAARHAVDRACEDW